MGRQMTKSANPSSPLGRRIHAPSRVRRAPLAMAPPLGHNSGHGVWMLLAVLVSLVVMMATMTIDAATTRAVTTTHEAISPRSSAEIDWSASPHRHAESSARPGRLEGRARQRADLLSVTGRSDIGMRHGVPFALVVG